MKSHSLLLAVFLLFTCSVIAQSELSTYPACAQSCLTATLGNSTCTSLLDTACTCKDATFYDTAQACFAVSCGHKDALVSTNATYAACGIPERDHTPMYVTVNTVFFIIAAFSMTWRLATRLLYGRTVWYDDLTIALIFAVDIVLYAVALEMTTNGHGLGKDIWTVPFNKIPPTMLYFWVTEMLYFTLLGLIKIGFLMFYLHIFPSKSFRIIIWVLIFFNLIQAFVFVIVTLFACKPISFVWNVWGEGHTGKCINSNAMAFSHAAISIVLDLITIILPMTQIWQLQLATKKKIGVLIMFSVGAFVTIVSVLRLKSLIHFSNTTNGTWDFLEASLWSIIEVNVGIICLCMPAIRLGLVRMFPTLLGSSHQSTSKTPKASTGGLLTKTNNGIAVSTSYKVIHSKRAQVNDDSSFIQLVEIEAADGRSNENVSPDLRKH